MKIAVAIALAAGLAGCVSASNMYASCDAAGADFGAVWTCTRQKAVKAGGGSRNAVLYVAYGDALHEQWQRGAFTTAQAKLLLAQAGAKIDADNEARAKAVGDAFAEASATYNASRPQTVNVNVRHY